MCESLLSFFFSSNYVLLWGVFMSILGVFLHPLYSLNFLSLLLFRNLSYKYNISSYWCGLRRRRGSQPYKWKDANLKKPLFPCVHWWATRGRLRQFKRGNPQEFVFFICCAAALYHVKHCGLSCDAVFISFAVKVWVFVYVSNYTALHVVWLCYAN